MSALGRVRGAFMKIKKVLKIIIFILASIFVLGYLGLLLWSKTGTYSAKTVAISALKSTDRVAVTEDKYIVFDPYEDTNIGLIFYPGGLVEPAAYAPVLHMIAEKGVFVVVTPMPFNLAILNTGAANSVIKEYPNISRWFLAGHSLGGAAAAIFAENNPAKIDAIAFWDSYPPNSANLSENNIPVLSIFGTTNDFPNTENFNDTRYLLPKNAVFGAIEGASHAQFGDYGPQKGDVVASISLTEQHEKVAKLMLDFIFSEQ